ncbi:MAG: hypothetical protein JWM80_1409 [Cyanobacteria bacterium RYN_339]|nr:hypothetical protein [Cyanobacteria bacterium RYN_339]
MHEAKVRGARRGITLVNVMMLALISTLFLMAASQFVTGSLKAGRDSRSNQQVYAVAKAGLDEALSWYRKQPIKPVKNFDIVSAASADTLDQQIGLVKEWEIDSTRHLWARFEVGRDPNAPIRTGVTSKGSRNTALYPVATYPTYYFSFNDGIVPAYSVLDWGAQDVSFQRGKGQAGTVWLLRSKGYTFRRTGSATSLITSEPFSLSTAARKPIQKIELESEVVLTNFHPHEAALYDFNDNADATQVVSHAQCAITGGHVNIHGSGSASNVDVRVLDGVGFNVWCNTGAANVHLTDDAGSNLFGPSLKGQGTTTNPNYVSPTLSDQIRSTFEVPDIASLKGLADYYYDQNSPPPAVLPQMAFIYINGQSMVANGNQVIFDGATVAGVTRPKLSGGGIIFVEGGATIDGTAIPQRWDGLIFTTGYYHQFNSSRITGGAIAGAHAIVHGESSKVAQLYYSRATLDQVIRQVRNYQEQRSTLTVVPGSSEDIIN